MAVQAAKRAAAEEDREACAGAIDCRYKFPRVNRGEFAFAYRLESIRALQVRFLEPLNAGALAPLMKRKVNLADALGLGLGHETPLVKIVVGTRAADRGHAP